VANPPYRVRVTGGNPYTIRVRTAAQGPQGPQGAQGPQGLPGGNYTLPAATNSTLGGIIVGDNLTIINGRLSGTPGGVTTFNGRTGNVILLANDVTSLANSVYLADTKAVPVSTTYGNDVFYGLRYKKNPSDPASFFAGQLSLGSTAVVSSQLTGMAASVELDPDDIFGGVRLRWNNMSVRLASDGLSAETGTASYTWSASSFLTQGRADSRYATPANLNAYLPTANFTYANLTGKPTFATVATSGSYSDLSGTPNLSLYLTTANAATTYYLQTNPSGYITAACLTYSNITGTPNLSLYLTTANAATTYLPAANFSYANLTGKPTTLAGYGITDGLTTTAAASTYATIASLSSYLTTASAASTYLTQSAASSTYATLSTNTFTGQQNYNSNILDKPRFQAWRESYTSPAISSGTLTLDLSGSNFFKVSLNAAITTLTISNVPTSLMASAFTLEFTADGSARAVTWPASIKWPSGTAPTLTSTNGKSDTFVFYSVDGGTSWKAFVSGQNQ
jgi:uncharacterized protein YjbI with pentapeptide repeats